MAQCRVGMAADVSVVAMTPDFGAEVRGVDLAVPLSDACFQAILDAFHRYSVIFLRGQKLDPRLLTRFAARFGELDMAADAGVGIPGLPAVSVIGGSVRDAKPYDILRHPPEWHSDGSHRARPPSITIMHAVQCANRGAGGVEFANMYAAYAALPRVRRLFVEKLRGIHRASVRVAATTTRREQDDMSGSAEHPLVRRHPTTGGKSIFACRLTVSRILGLAPDESGRLLDELERFATQPRFVYSHAWRRGDVLLWDNRCTLHRSLAFDRKGERVLHCVHVCGEAPLSV